MILRMQEKIPFRQVFIPLGQVLFDENTLLFNEVKYELFLI
jgi:hypothetical protein